MPTSGDRGESEKPRENHEVSPSDVLVSMMARGEWQKLGRAARSAERSLEELEAMRASTLERYKLLDCLRPHSLTRTSFCRRKRVQPTVQVQLWPDESIRLVGLETCGSVWSCPCCAARIYAERAREVTMLAETWRLAGGSTYMASFTVRHGLGDDLRKLRAGLANAWRRFWQGRRAKARREGWAIRHWVRAVEVMHSPVHGFHPHIHALLCTDGPLGDDEEREMAIAWQEAVRNELGPEHEPTLAHGVKLTVSTSANYLEKLGLEISQIATKDSKLPGHRSPWQIARDAAAGDAQSVQLWRQYTEAMRGARQLTWSGGTKKLFRIAARTDEELADESVPPDGGVGHVMAQFEAVDWDRYAKTIRHWTSIVIEAALHRYSHSELGKLDGVRERGPPGLVFLPRDRGGP